MTPCHKDRTEFDQNFQRLLAALRRKGLEDVVKKQLHPPDTIIVESFKRLPLINGGEYTADFVLKVGNYHGSSKLWASFNGVVVIEPTGGPSRYLGADPKTHIDPLRSNTWPRGVYTGLKQDPTSSRTHALILFDLARWAKLHKPTNIAVFQLPDLFQLATALNEYKKAAVPDRVSSQRLPGAQFRPSQQYGAQIPSSAAPRQPYHFGAYHVPREDVRPPQRHGAHFVPGGGASLPRQYRAHPRSETYDRPPHRYGEHDSSHAFLEPRGRDRGTLADSQPRGAPQPDRLREDRETLAREDRVSPPARPLPRPATPCSAEMTPLKELPLNPVSTHASTHVPVRQKKGSSATDQAKHQALATSKTDGTKKQEMGHDMVMEEAGAKSGINSSVSGIHNEFERDESNRECMIDTEDDATHHSGNRVKNNKLSDNVAQRLRDESELPETAAEEPELPKTTAEESDEDDPSPLPARNQDVDYATIDKLKAEVENNKKNQGLMDNLPNLTHFLFEQHKIGDYLPVRMLVGKVYHDVAVQPPAHRHYDAVKKVSILCDMWAQLKFVEGSSKSPSLEFVHGKPVDGVVNNKESAELYKKEAQKSMVYHELLTESKKGGAKLEKLFFWFHDKEHQLRALIKYGYILAAESSDVSLDDHLITINDTFVAQLRTVCQRLGKNSLKKLEDQEGGTPPPVYVARNGRKTIASSWAAEYAKETGVHHLDDLTKEERENIDGLAEVVTPVATPDPKRKRTRARRDIDGDESMGGPDIGDYDGQPASHMVDAMVDVQETRSNEQGSHAVKHTRNKRMRRCITTSSDDENSLFIPEHHSSDAILLEASHPVDTIEQSPPAEDHLLPFDADVMDVDADGLGILPDAAAPNSALAKVAHSSCGAQDRIHVQHQEPVCRSTESTKPVADPQQRLKWEVKVRLTSPFDDDEVPQPRSRKTSKQRKAKKDTASPLSLSNKDIAARIDILDLKRSELSGRVEKRHRKNARDNSKILQYSDEVFLYARMLLERQGHAGPEIENRGREAVRKE